MGPDDICRFSTVNREAHRIATDYITHRFSFLRILLRFFNTEEALHFWRLMATSGMLISGSSALQFFDRTFYPDSDLDVYLVNAYVPLVSGWLLSVGYSFRPSKEVTVTAANGIVLTTNTYERPPHNSFLPMTPLAYTEEGSVLDFENLSNNKKIQLITCPVCPLQLILGFHSSE